MASFGINLAHSNDGSRGVLELSAAEAIQPTGQSSKTADVTASGPIIYFCSGSESLSNVGGLITVLRV